MRRKSRLECSRAKHGRGIGWILGIVICIALPMALGYYGLAVLDVLILTEREPSQAICAFRLNLVK